MLIIAASVFLEALLNTVDNVLTSAAVAVLLLSLSLTTVEYLIEFFLIYTFIPVFLDFLL